MTLSPPILSLMRSVLMVIFCAITIQSYGQSDAGFYKTFKTENPDKCLCYDVADYYRSEYGNTPEILDSILERNTYLLSQIDEEDYFDHQLTRINLLHNFLGKTDAALPIIIELNNNANLQRYTEVYKRFNSLTGTILFNIGRHEESLIHYRKTLELSFEQNDSTNIKGTFINMGLVYESMSTHDSALYFFKRAKQLEEVGIMSFQNNLANSMAEVYYNQKNYGKAIEICAELMNSDPADAGYCFNLAAVQCDSGLYLSSIPLLIRADSLAILDRDLALQQKIHSVKKVAYEETGNYELALNAEFIKDSIEAILKVEANNRKLDELKNEQDRKLDDLKLLNKQKEIDLQRSDNRLFITLGVIALVLIVIYIFFLHYKSAKNLSLVKANLEIVSKEQNDNSENTTRKRDTTVVSDDLIQKIQAVLIEKELYKNPDISLALLAKKANSNTTIVSNIVNDHFGMSFRELINKLRIEEARRIFSDKNYDHYSIEGISQLVGYRSISSFNVNFKRIAGITPSYYRNKISDIR